MIDVSSLSESKSWPLVVRVARLLSSWDLKVWIVGGWVRDSLLRRNTNDVDFAVAGDGLDTAKKLAPILGGTFVSLDEDNRIGRVVLSGRGNSGGEVLMIDIAACQGSIIEDLARRDFTIDAMAADIHDPDSGVGVELIDPFHGLEDLEHRVIRATTGVVFSSDPVRLLRAVRLAAVLGFKVDPDTESLLRRDARLILQGAGERIREELLALVSGPYSGECLAYLDKLGLLTAVFPELEAARGLAQPAEHYWDVLQHCLNTVVALDFLLHQGAWDYTASDAVLSEVVWSSELEQHFKEQVGYGSSRATLLRIAALLHDIAKPKTVTIEPDGRVRYLGHAQEGAAMISRILERLRFSTKEIRFIGVAVEHHLRPTQMGLPDMPTRRAIYRYYHDTGEAAIGVLFLSLADHLATRGPALDLADWGLHARVASQVLLQHPEEHPRPVRLIDGYDIMSNFGLAPSPLVGELLASVQEARAAGEVTTKEEALDLVKRLLTMSS